MQQTTKYKLDLIEKDDVFSPDALNQNTQKVEEVLEEVTAHADAGDAAVTAAFQAADAALDGRVQFLEAKRVVAGSYKGDGNTSTGQTIHLGFTPFAVLAFREHNIRMVWETFPGNNSNSAPPIEITEGGFVAKNKTYDYMNDDRYTYGYVAFQK